jgi:hypothetical protein
MSSSSRADNVFNVAQINNGKRCHTMRSATRDNERHVLYKSLKDVQLLGPRQLVLDANLWIPSDPRVDVYSDVVAKDWRDFDRDWSRKEIAEEKAFSDCALDDKIWDRGRQRQTEKDSRNRPGISPCLRTRAKMA